MSSGRQRERERERLSEDIFIRMLIYVSIFKLKAKHMRFESEAVVS